MFSPFRPVLQLIFVLHECDLPLMAELLGQTSNEIYVCLSDAHFEGKARLLAPPSHQQATSFSELHKPATPLQSHTSQFRPLRELLVTPSDTR